MRHKLTILTILIAAVAVTLIVKPWAWGNLILGGFLYSLFQIAVITSILFIIRLYDDHKFRISTRLYKYIQRPIVISHHVNLLSDVYIPIQKVANTSNLKITAPVVSRVLNCFGKFLASQPPDKCQAIISALIIRSQMDGQEGQSHAAPDHKHRS